MSAKRILITGGAGYIGSHVNKELYERGFSSIVFDNLSLGHREFVKWGAFRLGDLAEPEHLRRVFNEHSIDAVMHFAAFSSVGESVVEPEKYYINNVANTCNLLQVMREFGVKRLIFSSTSAVFGNPQKLPLEENHPKNPLTAYGRSKLMVEQILEDYSQAYDLKYVVLRYFNAAGADPEGQLGEDHCQETHLIPLACYTGLGIRDCLSIFGKDYDTPDGTCIRDFIHVKDLAEAHALAQEYLLQGGASQVFNLGTGTGFSVREVVEAAGRAHGAPLQVKEVQRRPGDPPILVSDGTKARSILGWEPKITDLDAIVASAWNWHRKRHAR